VADPTFDVCGGSSSPWLVSDLKIGSVGAFFGMLKSPRAMIFRV